MKYNVMPRNDWYQFCRQVRTSRWQTLEIRQIRQQKWKSGNVVNKITTEVITQVNRCSKDLTDEQIKSSQWLFTTKHQKL
jgi:hypothetical protein